MESQLLLKLLKAVHMYYPIGFPNFNQSGSELRGIIGDKIDGKSNILKEWGNLIEDLRVANSNFVIQNLSFLQFPNLLLIIETSENFDNIIVYKRFVICFSLLCPYYTYFREYTHKVRIKEGLISFNSKIFLLEKQFSDLKLPISEQTIGHLVEKHFPHHSYISHYELMMNKIIGGVPYGIGFTGIQEYSFYQYLFNNEQPTTVFQ